MTSAIQRSFRLPIQIYEPVLGFESARAALGVTALELFELTDLGAFAWAWNIAVKTGRVVTAETVREHRRELIYLAMCVSRQKFLMNEEFRDSVPPALGFSITQVCNQILPHYKPMLRTAELMRAFGGCSRELVIDLIRAGELKLLKGTAIQPGRNQSALITRESVIAFLTRRSLDPL